MADTNATNSSAVNSRSREADQLRLLIEATTDYAIFLLDTEGRVATWNAGAQRLKGYKSEEIIGQHFSRFYPQDAIDRGWPAHELRVARAEGRFEDEGWRIRKDGSRFWANVVITAVHDESGAFCGFGKITRDLTERKKAEANAVRVAEEAITRRALEEKTQLIQKQREQLQVTLTSIGDGVIATDLDAKVTFMNSIAAHLTGWSEAEAANRPLEDVFKIVNEETRAEVANPAHRALREGRIVGLANHTILISKDGTERPIADSAAPIRDEKNNVTGSVLVFRDVSKERQNEHQRNVRLAVIQLLNSASTIEQAAGGLLQNICDNLGWEVGFYWSVDEANASLVCKQSWHRRGADVQGFEQASCSRRFAKGEGLPGRIWASRECAWIIDIVRDDNFPRFGHAIQHGLRSAFGCPITISDECLGVIEFFSKKLEQTDNDLLEVMTTVAGSFAQFIERKTAEQHLRTSEQELTDFFENATVGLHWVGPDGTILRANRAELELLGYTRDEYVGRNITEFHADRDVIDDILCRLKAKEALHGYEARLRCKDGSIKHVLISSNVLWKDGHFIHTRCFTRDITDRKVAEDALRKSEARLSEELEAISRLHALSTRILGSQNRQSALDDILQEAVHASHADFGNIQLYNAEKSALEIVAHVGFSREFLDHFRLARADDGTCCARAMARGKAVVIEDVNLDSTYEPHWRIASSTGYRAIQSTPIKSRDGRVLGVLSTHFRKVHRPSDRDLALVELHARHAADLIDRYEIETALRRSEEQFRELTNTMPQIVWTAGPDGEIDYLNQQWSKFTGLPVTVGNAAWQQILHPDDAEAADKAWADCMQTGSPFEMELRLFDRRENAHRWHLIRTVAVRDEAGNIVRWFGTGTDIHNQKRAEEALRYLAEASAALAGVVDYESTLQKVANLAVPYFADWSAVDVLEDGSLRRLAVSHQDLAKLELANELSRTYPVNLAEDEGVAAVLRTGKPQIVSDITDEMLIAGARDEKHLELIRSLGLKSYICVPLIVGNESFGVLTFATAESGRKYGESDLTMAIDLANRASVAVNNTQLYEALRDNDRRKDEFLATLAHELRNPLAPIRNSLQILKLGQLDEDTVERSLDMMERQLQHLVRLVDDLLDVSRVMRGKIELRKESVELAAIVARAIETVQPLIDAQGHHLTVKLPSESVTLNADPVRLAQVIGNLLTNSAKYTEPGGRIALTVERSGETAQIRIRDNGIGIEKHLLPRIFELFVQAEHGTTRTQGGLGIGLTLVRNLVEMHNGTVEAHSEGLGKGSEFVVTVPANTGGTRRPARSEAGSVRPKRTESGLRLLVVDDNQDSANSLAMLLRFQGHDVRVAYGGEAALTDVPSYEPHAVFLDIGMPGIDGYEVARRLRQQFSSRKLVLAALTGWGQQDDRRRTAEAGFDHHLVKPVEPQALKLVLDQLAM